MLRLIINIYYFYQCSVYIGVTSTTLMYIHTYAIFYGGKFPTCQQPMRMASCKADFLCTLDNTVAN